MLDDLPPPPGESAEEQKSAIDQLHENIEKLGKEVDPYIGPIHWIIEIEQQKRHKSFWKGLALFSLIYLSIIYLLATIFLIQVIIKL